MTNEKKEEKKKKKKQTKKQKQKVICSHVWLEERISTLYV